MRFGKSLAKSLRSATWQPEVVLFMPVGEASAANIRR